MPARNHLPCPTCGASGAESCTSFDMRAPGVPGPRYPVAPHVWRDTADTYWRAVSIRLALVEGRKP